MPTSPPPRSTRTCPPSGSRTPTSRPTPARRPAEPGRIAAVRAARPFVATVLALAVRVAGCGNARQRVPDPTRAQKPEQAERVTFAAAGVSLAAPRNWLRGNGSDPLVALFGSGPAAVAVWRYPRKEPIPKNRSELEQAQANLSDAVQARDRSARIESPAIVDVHGVKGIQVVASERIDGRPRRVRSTHLFDRGAEIVVDAYAPPSDFAGVDRSVFEPLIRSLR